MKISSKIGCGFGVVSVTLAVAVLFGLYQADPLNVDLIPFDAEVNEFKAL